MPFVVIQIVMVGLIIAFPALVSSNLAKEPTIDVDKAFQQMQMAPKDGGVATPPGAPSPAASSAGPAGPAVSGPTADAVTNSDDDAMRRLLESMQKEPKKP